MITYLLTKGEVLSGKPQNETLLYWPSDSEANAARVENEKTERSRLINCSLCDFSFGFAGP